jgi:hypothetical protein
MENLDLVSLLLPAAVTLVTLAVVKGLALLKKVVLKTETKVDDALLEAVLKALEEKE